MRPFFGERDWKRLPKNARGSISDAVLQLVWDDAAEAIKSGLFDEREDRHLSRSVLAVDEQGWEELHDVLAETLDRAMQIQANSASRAARRATRARHVQREPRDGHPSDAGSREEHAAPASGTRKKRRSSCKILTAAKA